ncbi:uncharacterized protein [Drosophila tropicalis]|uniref:uncharacterized protein n=1 Tax=Drosophila tropicalis TaxID=46794 RepID=UPI0035ABC471
MQWSLVLSVLVLILAYLAESRQIRINRYAVSVQEDDDIASPATVREVTPYPASGYRPKGRSFWLPGEGEVGSGAGSASDSDYTTTTDATLDDSYTSTTETVDFSTTTNGAVDATTTDLPLPVDTRSGRAYVKAPYPAAGYRPSRAFLLPTEQQQQQLQDDSLLANNNASTNANHPVCGVSTNPLKPTPEPGSKDEPDSESVVITGNLGPAVLVASAPVPRAIPVAIPLRSQPLRQGPPRGFVYSTHVEQRW